MCGLLREGRVREPEGGVGKYTSDSVTSTGASFMWYTQMLYVVSGGFGREAEHEVVW